MKPIRLTFSGIRSYRAPAVVDFANLDLFAIIGETGAGKSTILEALTFALYGRKTWSGGKLDELIADGEKRMIVEFTFAAAEDTWTVTRSRNRTSTADSHKLVNASGSVKVDNAGPVTDKVTELLGLKFEQFTTAVVMRQGRFDELLRASATERTHILTSILGLDELKAVNGAAEALRRQWADPVIGARKERDLLGPDPPGVLEAASLAAEEASARHAALSASALAATSASAEQQRLQGGTAALRTELGRLPAIDVAGVMAKLEGLGARGRQLLDDHERAQQASSTAEAVHTRLGVEETCVLGGLADRDAVLSARDRLRHLAGRLADLHRQRATVEQAIAERRASPPPAEVDPLLTGALREAEAARESAVKLAEERAAALETGTQRWEALVLAGIDLSRLEQERSEVRAAVDVARAFVEQAQGELDARSEALAAADRAREEALRADAAAAAAAHRHPGDDCPVCARPLPPTFEPPVAPNLDAADAALGAAREEQRKASEVVAEANRTLARATSNAELADRAAAEAAERLEQAETAAEAAGVSGRPGTQEEVLSAFTAEAEAAARAQDAADADLATARDAVEAARGELARARGGHEAELHGLTARLADIEAQLSGAQEDADGLPAAWRPHPLTEPSLADAIAGLDGAATRLAELSLARQQVQDEAARARAAMETVRAEAAENVQAPARMVLNEVNQRVDRSRDVGMAAKALASVLDDADLGLAEPPERFAGEPKVANLPDVTAGVRTCLDAARAVEVAGNAVLAAAQERLGRVEGELAAALRDAGHSDLAALQAAAGEARHRAESAREAVVRAAADRDRSLRLDEVLAVGEPFIDNLDVIIAAMRPGGFVQHLLKSREMELLAEATRRLRAITKGRFGFVADFGVVNTASGEVRSPDSLSGGERFQAALALALALVEIASRGAGRLDAVFVDEGFGSLDAGALDMALATLGSVAGGGKTVALISHLRPVAEYVETVLHVTRSDVAGSRIDRLEPDGRDKLVADDIRSGLTA